jgi:predicted CXXCH cytochrome family protein
MRGGVILALLTGILLPSLVWAEGFDEVLLTRHNLFPGGTDALIRDVCQVCHIEPIRDISPRVAEALPMGMPVQPEGSDIGSRTAESAPAAEAQPVAFPLWDSQSREGFYLPLPKVKPDPVRKSKLVLPFGPSFDCLSCHDGVLGSDVHQITSNASDMGLSAVLDRQRGITDHPDSILYPRKSTGEFVGRDNEVRLLRYWSIPDRNENGLNIPKGPVSDRLGLDAIDLTDPVAASDLIRTFQGVIHCDSCHNPHNNVHRPFLRVAPKDLCLTCHQR